MILHLICDKKKKKKSYNHVVEAHTDGIREVLENILHLVWLVVNIMRCVLSQLLVITHLFFCGGKKLGLLQNQTAYAHEFIYRKIFLKNPIVLPSDR